MQPGVVPGGEYWQANGIFADNFRMLGSADQKRYQEYLMQLVCFFERSEKRERIRFIPSEMCAHFNSRHHKREGEIDNPWLCNFLTRVSYGYRMCGKRFATKHDLEAHLLVHAHENFFVLTHSCRYCGAQFRTASNRVRHESKSCTLRLVD